jgi:TolB-like protein
MKTLVVAVALFVVGGAIVSAAGESEAASSSTRGKYLAGQGIIIPSTQVHVNSYVAGVDYGYPKPEGQVGVTFTTGNRLMSTGGGEALLHIGIQAGEMEFDDLPPMNLAFVIDKSGSMNVADKMGWVVDAFDIFIEQVRDIDFVSLIVFDSSAKVIYPSTSMSSRAKRLRFKQAVHTIYADGGTNLVDGLELGYQQVMANYRSDYTNRVLFLTDGVGDSGGILRMAEEYKELGINVSTIGVGQDFDLDLMVNLAKAGGGSSRFISDRTEMEGIFGSELDRMVVPAAKDLLMSLTLPSGFEVLETWGYHNEIRGNEAQFSQGTLHHRDYETVLVKIRVPPTPAADSIEIGRFEMSYELPDGVRETIGPLFLHRTFVSDQAPISGYSEALVLRSGTMLHLAEDLRKVGDLYYSCREDLNAVNTLRDRMWRESGNAAKVSYEELSTSEIRELEGAARAKMQKAMDITVASRNELSNARLRLDDTGFDDEIGILTTYLSILGRDMEMQDEQVATYVQDLELKALTDKRSIHEHLGNLFREMSLSMSSRDPGVIAVSGFTAKDDRNAKLLDLLNEMAVIEIARFDSLTVVERSEIDKVMDEQKLSLSSLIDTDKAIAVGNLLSANYILTGSLIEMSGSVVVFGRIINTESAEIESVAQVILPKNADVALML